MKGPGCSLTLLSCCRKERLVLAGFNGLRKALPASWVGRWVPTGSANSIIPFSLLRKAVSKCEHMCVCVCECENVCEECELVKVCICQCEYT